MLINMRNWPWAVSLGTIWWVLTLLGMMGMTTEWLAKNISYLSELVALSIGVVYAFCARERLVKLPWKLVWGELGIVAMVVYLVWAGLLGASSLLLDET